LDLFVTFPTDNPALLAQNHRVAKNVTNESRLEQDARNAREELLKRKRARDLHRKKQVEQDKDVLRRFAVRGSNVKH
jgi:hypothetical protein